MKKIALLLLLLLADSAFGQVTTYLPASIAFPQIAFGGDPGGQNYVTLIQIANNNSLATSAHLALYSDGGTPLAANFDGQAAQSTLDFSLAAGATRQIQLTLNGAVTAGWMLITYTPSDAQTQVILQFRSGTTLLSEVGVQPAYSGMLDTYFAAETDTGLNTGIAVVNPDAATANILATLRDPNTGGILASTPISLPANGHMAKFLTELFPIALNITQIRAEVGLDACSDATCTVAAPQGSVGFLATALRLNGGLFTTLPVVDTSVGGGDLVRVLPHVVFGGPSGGINYQTVLYFTTDLTAGVFGTIDIFNDDGSPLAASANGAAPASSIPFTVLGDRVTRIVLSSDQNVHSGWIRLTLPSSVDLVANAVFQTFTGSTLASEAGVLDSPPGLGGLIYVNVQAGVSDVGVAFANPQSTPVTVNLTLFDQKGAVAATQAITLPAYGHLPRFVTEIFSQYFSQLPAPISFTGALNIYSPVSFSALALRLTGNNIATMPVGSQGMYRPSITGVRVTQTVKSPPQVNFSVDATDLDADLATGASTAVAGYAYIDLVSPNYDVGYFTLDGTPMIGRSTGTISGFFQLPDYSSIPSGYFAVLYIYIYDSVGNVSNWVSVPLKF